MQIWFHTQVPEFNKKSWFSNKINPIFTPSNPISRNSARFDKIHPDFTKFSSEVQKFSRGGKWCKIGFSRGAKWRKVAQSGAKWRKVVQSGAKWRKVAQNWFSRGWISEILAEFQKVAQSGAKWRKIGSAAAQNDAKLVRPWRKLLKIRCTIMMFACVYYVLGTNLVGFLYCVYMVFGELSGTWMSVGFVLARKLTCLANIRHRLGAGRRPAGKGLQGRCIHWGLARYTLRSHTVHIEASYCIHWGLILYTLRPHIVRTETS